MTATYDLGSYSAWLFKVSCPIITAIKNLPLKPCDNLAEKKNQLIAS